MIRIIATEGKREDPTEECFPRRRVCHHRAARGLNYYQISSIININTMIMIIANFKNLITIQGDFLLVPLLQVQKSSTI